MNLRQGALDGIRLLSNHFQVVVFSRESQEDSWSSTEGGQIVKFNEQNKQIKALLQAHPDLRLDGFYTSLVPVKQQTLWDDY